MSDYKKIEAVRHSLSHLMTMAISEMYPGVGLGVGPFVEDGFYQDYDLEQTINPELLPKIEKRIKELIKQDLKFEQHDVSLDEAYAFYKNDPYKTEMINDLKSNGSTTVSFYKSGDFDNLCAGPHVASTKEINPDAFKLTRISGAYWRGDEKNKMLQRIYGVAFESKEELEQSLEALEQAKQRDHRKLGRELELYFIDDEMVGKGLIMWTPNGTIVRDKIEALAKQKEDDYGYKRVSTPHIAKEQLYLKSGHLPYYQDDMYPAMKMDDGTYYLKAMNCPHHHRIFQSKLRSYRDLPLRIAEYGTCYRNELSGTLAGLLRVRALTMNDAHIYCSKEQIKQEFIGVLRLTKEYFDIFGLNNYWFRLSKWSPDNKDKYIDEPDNWEYSQNILREALLEEGVEFQEADDEAAFYGPKVDIQFKSVIGREETMSTIQLDFAAKTRFGFDYDGSSGEKGTDVFVIHRAPLSVHERFLAFLIENYAGWFPFWLAPEQVRILTVNDTVSDYVAEVEKAIKGVVLMQPLKYNELRYSVDDRNESLGKKIREATQFKIPIQLIIGPKDAEAREVSVRTRSGEEKISLDGLSEYLNQYN